MRRMPKLYENLKVIKEHDTKLRYLSQWKIKQELANKEVSDIWNILKETNFGLKNLKTDMTIITNAYTVQKMQFID